MLDSKIVAFLEQHHVMSIATSVDNIPYCANVFYAYIASENVFVCSSNSATRHVDNWMKNPMIAATVALETKNVGKIQGVQLCGVIKRPDGAALDIANRAYYNNFPFTKLMNVELWIIEPTSIKMTDNRLCFGEKILWGK